MPLAVEVQVNIGWVPASNPAFLAQQQSNIPGQGQPTTAAVGVGTGMAMATGQNARSAFMAQVRQYITMEPIPIAAGSEASVTLANILTALTNAINDIAGSTGTPFINSVALAEIQGWASGNP